MKIYLNEYKKASADYKDNWALVNQVLYKMCKNYHFHKDLSTINAKVWIIGRTLATGIERMISSSGAQGDSLGKLTKHMYKNRTILDSIFNRLLAITEPLTIAKLEVIVMEHGKFVRLLAKILRKNQSARSFASKYMHFHCPVVPIYDRYASGELRRICRWEDSYEVFELPRGADEEYYYFALRFWQLYKKFKEAVGYTNARLIDCYLLWMAEE
jgi:hypothetical protein